jgi:hypothetical protein
VAASHEKIQSKEGTLFLTPKRVQMSSKSAFICPVWIKCKSELTYEEA